MVSEWLSIVEYPFKSHYFPAKTGRIHYIDEGNGEVLLMLHGMPVWSFFYRDLIKNLMDSYRCLVPDLPGFGLSDQRSMKNYEPEIIAQDLEEWIDTLKIDSFSLIIHDYGGPLIMPCLLKNISRVNRIIILNSWMWPLKAPWFSPILGGSLGKSFYMLTRPPLKELKKAKRRKNLDAENYSHYHKPFILNRSHDPYFVLQKASYLRPEWLRKLWEQKEQIRDIPALILWGMKGKHHNIESMKRWQAVFDFHQLQEFSDHGSLMVEESPDKALMFIRNFLLAPNLNPSFSI